MVHAMSSLGYSRPFTTADNLKSMGHEACWALTIQMANTMGMTPHMAGIMHVPYEEEDPLRGPDIVSL